MKEPVVEDPIALCAEGAAEIERLRAENEAALRLIDQIHRDGGHNSKTRGFIDSCEDATMVVVDLRASEAQAVADADALATLDDAHMVAVVLRYSIKRTDRDRLTAYEAYEAYKQVRASAGPALSRAAERRSKAKGGAQARRVPMPEPFVAGSRNMICREFCWGERDIATGVGAIDDVPEAIAWLIRAAAWVADRKEVPDAAG